MATSTVEDYVKGALRGAEAQRGPDRSDGPVGVGHGSDAGHSHVDGQDAGWFRARRLRTAPGVRLTPHGERVALHVLRRHRIVELFLVKVLGIDWSVVHEEADALEHAISDRVLERLDTLLGHPTVDPHGDPIPTSRGQVDESDLESLANCPIGVPQRICRVLDQGPAFLQFIERQGLMPGAAVTVEERETAAAVVNLRLSSGEAISLGLGAAANILVNSLPCAPKAQAV